MRRLSLVFPALLVISVSGLAQINRPTAGFEVRSLAGAYVPTGAQQDDFKTATLLGVQVAREFSDHFHVLGSVSWTHGHNKLGTLNNDQTFIWQYDAGVEFNLLKELGRGWLLRPLAGVGAGARTYDYRASGFNAKTCTAGYGSVGSEFQRETIALRLEARGNLHCFESPFTGKKETRNDLGLTLGIVYHIR